MSMDKMSRRGFLGGTGGVAATVALPLGAAAVTLVINPSDPVAAGEPVRRAVSSLERALRAAGFAVVRKTRVTPGALSIVASGPAVPEERAPEGFTIRQSGTTLTATGGDARGLSFALRELADRVSRDPENRFQFHRAARRAPINPVAV